MNIWLVKIWVLSQVLLNKLNFSILHWVKFWLDKDDQKEGLFNRLKNIEDKSEDQSKKQLDAIKNNEHKFKTAKYDFSNFTFPSKFASKICNKTLMLQEAEDNQQELEILTQAK